MRFDVESPRPGESVTVRGRRGERVLPIGDGAAVAVPVDVPRGHSLLELRFSRPVDADSDAAPALSGVRFTPSTRGPTLVPALVSADPGF
jgi:hypothetical protein